MNASICGWSLADLGIAAVLASLTAVTSAAGATRPDGWTVGEKTILYVRADLPDKPGELITRAEAQSLMNEVDAYFRDVSGGLASVRATVTPTTLRMPRPSSFYAGDGKPSPTLINDARAAALAYDRANGGTGLYDSSRYAVIVVFIPFIGDNPSAGGSASSDGQSIYINGDKKAMTVAHELGHCYGLPEGCFWQAASTNPIGDGTMIVYGNPFDVMGSPTSAGHFSARGKHFLKWLPTADTVTITQSGTYRVYRHDHAQSRGLRALAVPSASPATRTYWIESRKLPASNARLADGVLVSWSTPATVDYTTATSPLRTLRNEELILLDMKPHSFPDYNNDNQDSPLAIGETFVDAESGVTITPVASGGTSPVEWVDVRVELGRTGEVAANRTVAMAADLTGRLVQQGAILDLPWSRSGLGALKIEYSLDGGATWSTAATNVASATTSGVVAGSGAYRWTVPAAMTASALVRLSDATDPSVTVTSGAFSITPDNVPAAQAAADANTVALFHFEGDLANAATATSTGTPFGKLTFQDGGLKLGQALRIDNTSGGSCMTVAANSAFALSGNWTIQFWMKVNSTGGIYSGTAWVLRVPGSSNGDDAFLITLHNDRSLSASIKSAADKVTSFSHLGGLEFGQWYHLALVGDATQSKLLFYVQDRNSTLIFQKEQAVAVADLTLKDTGKPLSLGGGTGTSNVQFDGWIDELQITRQAIDPTRTPAVGLSRIINLSILTTLAVTGDSFTMGYVVGGSGTSGSQPLVIRAIGPSLSALGVPAPLDDPKIEFFSGASKTGENDNWGGTAELAAAFAAVGAFPCTNKSTLDAAASTTVAAGSNSVKVSAANNGVGTVIAEIYDASSAAAGVTAPRLVNVSVLKHLGSGLAAGFAIGGAAPKTVLIRAIGPTLGASPFQLPGVVADPQIALFDARQSRIAENGDWGGGAALAASFAQVGAFSLPATSRDAALVATLSPGNYTVQVTGVNNTTGLALVEVYEVP